MRKAFLLYFLVILLSVVSLIFYFITSSKKALISPVLGISKQRLAENVWFPKEAGKSSPEDTKVSEQITANAAFFVETQSGQVLFSKNQYEKYSVASLTKIMTVIVALENKSMEDIYTVSQRASDMEPDKMLLIAGERLSLKKLLEGIFLVSANDGAEVLAEGTTGRREEFINLMNSKALQLGMSNTYFVNPTGLEEDPWTCFNKSPCQYSSAFDVLLMSHYAIGRWPELISITSQPQIFIEATSDHQDYDLYSGINLLTTYPGVIGFKTGFTPEAGLTLVTLARRGDKEVMGVLLGATDRRDDAKLLLDYSFRKLGV